MLSRIHFACLLITAFFCGFPDRFHPVERVNTFPARSFSFDFNLLQSQISLQSGDPLLKADTASCSIPFTLAGKLILVKGRADTTEGNFILDTGAPNLVLNSTYFRNYPVEQDHTESQETITGRQVELAQRTTVKLFKLGTMNYFRAEANLANLGNIENSKGVKILGLLGVSLFKECELVIDYKKSMIHLHHIGKKERKTYQHPMLKDSSRYTVYPFEVINNRILIKTSIGGKELPFVIDYAAESNIIDSRLPGRVLDSVLINGRVLLVGAGNRKVEAITGDLPNFTLGRFVAGNLPVIIMNLEYTCFGQENCISGVLGQEFLSRYTLVLNFEKRKLYILND